MKRVGFYFFILLFVVVSSGCNTNSIDSDNIELTVAAAASLSNAFTEIAPIFEEETGIKLTFSYGSTGQLAEQILNGAPFDIFASADIKTVDQLRDKELIIANSQETYAFGKIGIATPKQSSIVIENLYDLLKEDVVKIAIANPEHAPFGLAAKQALETSGLWEKVDSKIVYGRNIADALTFIETGNAEAGIISKSLVNNANVNFYPIDDSLYEPIGQSIAILNHTKHENAAREFINFIKGPIGKPIMESYGFIIPTE